MIFMIIAIALGIFAYCSMGIIMASFSELSERLGNPLHKIWITLLWPVACLVSIVMMLYEMIADYIYEVRHYYARKKKEAAKEAVKFSPSLSLYHACRDGIVMDSEALDENTKKKIRESVEKVCHVPEGFLKREDAANLFGLNNVVVDGPSCNDCTWINITEKDQEEILLSTGQTIFHKCVFYGEHLKHESVKPDSVEITPCKDCKAVMYRMFQQRKTED